MTIFTIQSKLPNSFARTGVIHTPHGDIETPAFIVAGTKAAVKALTVPQITELGGEAILANTYHLILQPGTKLIEDAGGLANFMGWHRPAFTDSGGFQIMSLPGTKITETGVEFKSHLDGGKFTITPESSMQAQWQIGADIHMAFDCPVGYGAISTAYENAEKTMRITHDWAAKSLAEHQRLLETTEGNPQFLYGVVQGGEYEDLRKSSASYFAGQNFDGYGIGGMYDAKKDAKFLKIVDQILPEDKPKHWLGMGAEPLDLFTGIENGIDTFDCVAPTRQARNGALYTSTGRINIRNAKYARDFTPIDETCHCRTCQNYTKSYIRHLFQAKEILACTLSSIHNEYFVVNTVKKIRESIIDGTFDTYKSAFLAKYYG